MEAADIGSKRYVGLNLNHKVVAGTCWCLKKSVNCVVVVIQGLLGCGKSAGL